MIPLPYRDDNPTRRTPIVTYALIAINVGVWLAQLIYGVEMSTLDYGAIPSFIVHGTRDGWLRLPEVGRVLLHQEVPARWTVLTSMFMHGGWLHIAGNMWFLWLFGDNVEDALGPLKYLAFYLLCGVAAAASQVLAMPTSTVPMIGASGAIAGVLGAYLVLYPRANVRCLWILFVFITTVSLPAWLLLGLWFLSQLVMPGSGVAWMAHVGGFIAGAATVWLFLGFHRPTPPPRRQPWPDRRYVDSYAWR